MLNFVKPSLNWISELSLEKKLDENTARFILEANHINLSRIRIMSQVAFAIFAMLWIFDLFQFLEGKWNDSSGYRIIMYVHSFLLVFLAGVHIFCRKSVPEEPDDVTAFHKIMIACSLFIVQFCTVLLALGDVLTNGSIAAYLGMVFAYASIFIMTNRFSFFLYMLNMTAMVFLLILVNFLLGRSMNVQIINTVTFTLVAFIMSRILFYYTLKDFKNRLLINKQAHEIGKKNEEKKKLIGELRHALAEVKTLGGLLPICASCKKIRDDQGYWNQIETYIQKHSGAEFSHGICPECSDKIYGDEAWYIKMKKNGTK